MDDFRRLCSRTYWALKPPLRIRQWAYTNLSWTLNKIEMELDHLAQPFNHIGERQEDKNDEENS